MIPFGTGMRLRRGVPGGNEARPSTWRAWLDFNTVLVA
jgi:hypothetical protein